MFNTKIDLNLDHIDDNLATTTETIQVVLQEASPFITGDIFTDNIGKKGAFNLAGVVKDMVGVVIISPKNIVEQIEKSDNAYAAIKTLFTEINSFCGSPKRYVLLQKKSKEKPADLEQSDTQPNSDGSETTES